MYTEPKAHNRGSRVIVKALWWEHCSQMGCDDKEKKKKIIDVYKLIIVWVMTH